MKSQRKFDVYKIEYEIPPKMNAFSVWIAAESHEAAIGHLQKVMGRTIMIKTSGLFCPLHDLTPVVRNLVTGLGEKKVTKEEKIVTDTIQVESGDEDGKFKSGRGRKPGYKTTKE
jgi:hypothetical protein